MIDIKKTDAPVIMDIRGVRYQRIEAATPETRFSLDDIFNKNFVRVTTKPHKNLSLKQKMNFQERVFYYISISKLK